jgi:hypothetical protein
MAGCSTTSSSGWCGDDRTIVAGVGGTGRGVDHHRLREARAVAGCHCLREE